MKLELSFCLKRGHPLPSRTDLRRRRPWKLALLQGDTMKREATVDTHERARTTFNRATARTKLGPFYCTRLSCCCVGSAKMTR